MKLRTTQDFISAYDADKAWVKELIIEKKRLIAFECA